MLNYGLVSTAIAEAEDRQRLLEGVRLLAESAHKHRIPITWCIDTASAPVVAKSLTPWHTENGDAPILMLDIRPLWEMNWAAERDAHPGASTEAMASHLVTMREKLPAYIIKERERLARSLPWAEPTVAGTTFKNDVVLRALEQTGFRGLWGYHPPQQTHQHEKDASTPNRTDTEPHRGGFGCFYPLEAPAALDSMLTPGNSDQTAGHAFEKIVGLPYHSADLLTEDAQNLRAALLNGTAHQHYDVYTESTPWNRWLGYVEHIDPLTVAQLGAEGLKRLDTYFAHIVNATDAKHITLPQMVEDYRTRCKKTEPTAIVGVNPKPQTETDTPKSTLKIFYYDATCELAFNEGTMDPVEIRNYAAESERYTEADKPALTGFLPHRHRSELRITIVVEATRAMPYGLAVWGDHHGLKLAESNADDVRWIGKHSLFIRLSLNAGKNEFHLKLGI